MIDYITGNIFDTNAQCLVNPVNTVGVMGAGLALKFKRQYPHMFNMYKLHCNSGTLKVGSLMFYKSSVEKNSKIICLFPTKEHWKNPSKIEYIKLGLQSFVQYYQEWNITSVAFPLLGCGLGGLDWEHEVQPLYIKYLSPLPINVSVYI